MSLDRVYEELVEYYDWEHRDFLADLPLYLGYAQAQGGQVLDAGCGTGRLLIPIANAGYTVTGVDSSTKMLEVASARVTEEGVADRVRLAQGDLRGFGLDREFGLAFVALGTFHHLLTLADQRAALDRLARHVRQAGLLILDLINPTPEWLSAADDVPVHQLTAPFPEAESQDLLTKLVVRSSLFESQVDRQLHLYDRVAPDGAVIRSISRMDLRYLFRYEAEMLISGAGFRIRDLFGSYDFEPYDRTSDRMIYVAEKI